VDVGDDVGAALAAYETACRSAMAQSSESAKATGLRRALVARQESEQARDKALEQVIAAENRLRDTAASAGLGRDGDPPSLIAGLRAWQAKRGATIKEGQRSLLEWQELQGILGGRTLDDLVREADEKALRASKLAEGLGARPPDADGATAGEPDLDTLHTVADELAERANRLDGQCGNAESQLAAVPEAEEAVQRAQDEVARLERLRDTLTRTVEILDAAQARVHRDLAPVLGAALRVNLASVTGGRYVDAAVNPGDLVVKVKETAALGGHWRNAQTLSRGTREQVYLLLRAAMAQYLVTKDERAPLLLDEVTAQSDAVRTAAVLSVLHRISADRQVILFSHDAIVGAWAREHLGDRDRLVTLAVQGTPA